ncbi:MAG: UDP-2,3-diacylglucosamine diphosphatase [Alphaproteobacteria bacterium]|nr:UDP-2,3-diacylglucosamine diphosphatase [Alphaproteobacteria bacterium]
MASKKQKISQFETIWISDVHLGSKGAKATELLNFLTATESRKLYLVGDIIDCWRLRKRWYWPQTHNDVMQKIMEKSRAGTEVIYIPGNHDDLIRQFVEHKFGNIQIMMDDIHITKDGKKFWVMHGDLFDSIIQHVRWLAFIGDGLYTLLLGVNGIFNAIRRLFRLEYWSLSKFLKQKVKQAVSFLSAFETGLMNETRKRGCDGVVCGHIHKAEIKIIDGLVYANDGDWVESKTALTEDENGIISLINFDEFISDIHK